jgi:probable F420-dependent oxidoreductase
VAGWRIEGEFYEHRLMTPMFAPAPLTGGPPPLLLAGVGPRMCAVAGEVADGLVAHPFGTPEFLREQVLPGVRAARATSEAAGEAWTQRPFEVDAGVLIATGETPAEIAAATTALRERIAFYASTPAYVGVLARHGHTAIQPELHSLSMRGKWAEMGRLIDDDLLHAVGVVGDSSSGGRRGDAAVWLDRRPRHAVRLSTRREFCGAAGGRGNWGRRCGVTYP